MDEELEEYLAALKRLRKSLKLDDSVTVSKKAFREESEQLGQKWFKDFVKPLTEKFSISEDTTKPYSVAAERLIRLSAPSNKKSSYLTTIDSLIKNFRTDFIIPLKSTVGSDESPTAFDAFVANLSDPEESEYFQEALDCAKQGFLRAAAVLAWCAAIDRVHKRIEKVGFTAFNVASARMASEQIGRFKKFNQTQNVTSISDLRAVFDTSVLWVIEGMGMIDLNEHTRLRSCFDMRNHAAHPGNAPIKPFNLMSMFSDIQEIILSNSNFDIT